MNRKVQNNGFCCWIICKLMFATKKCIQPFTNCGEVHGIVSQEKKITICFRPGSNRRPSACKADVITTTLRELVTNEGYTQWCPNQELVVFYSFLIGKTEKNKSRKYSRHTVVLTMLNVEVFSFKNNVILFDITRWSQRGLLSNCEKSNRQLSKT